MPQKDKTSYVSLKLATILEACKSADGKIKDYLSNSEEKPDLVPELFQMLNSVDDLLELAIPTKTTGEFHGLSKSETNLVFTKVLFTHLDRPDWNFTAWFSEKVANIKLYVKKLILYWEMDYQEIQLRQDAPGTPKEYIKDGVKSNLENIKIYTQLVFDEVLNNRLEIKEISSE